MTCIPMRPHSTSLEAMVRSVTSLMEPFAKDARITLKVVMDPGLPKTIMVDEDKIAWTLGMLIGNALRHAAQGSFFHPGGQIVTRATPGPKENQVTIEVSDDGPGIPADKLPLLFQPAPYQRRVGYALILGREIAQAHGGDLEVTSSQDPVGHGTHVRLVLPTA
jgi:signal transduction histidine kinase